MRALLATLALGLATPAVARIKVDRYEPATLPEITVWVTLLDRDKPLAEDFVRAFTLFGDGKLLTDSRWTTAGELGRPMAVALVVEAHREGTWPELRDAIGPVFKDLPEGSRGFAIAATSGNTRLPEAGFSDTPAELPASLRGVRASGDGPRLFRATRAALRSFPLRPGLDPDPTDGELPRPPAKGEPTFPLDRVLYLLGAGGLERDLGGTRGRRLRELVELARRRGVRIMAVGYASEAPADLGDEVELGDELSLNARGLANLEVLARKTGGTYRRAVEAASLERSLSEAAQELRGRYVITAEAKGARRGDRVTLTARARLTTGAVDTSRGHEVQIENVLGFWASVADWISDTWEQWPWWARTLLICGVLLVVGLIALVVLLRKASKRRKARQATAATAAAALAARKPCAVCGNIMMPDWTECLFCAQAAAANRPMRFRLVGRAGALQGQALRFDKELIVIGSGEGADVLIRARGVATEHCGLRDRGGEEFIVSDFNTDSGTWLNGNRIAQARIYEGDVLRIGDTELVFGIEA